MSRTKSDYQRIKVDRQGYDASGAYWGAGHDVFIIEVAGGDGVNASSDQITVRARNLKEARKKAAAELARKPGEPRSQDPETIGGASPHKSRYEIDWCDPETGETVRIAISHARDYLSQGTDQLEIQSLAPRSAPLPITDTGYLSHFLDPLALVNAGGPVTFVTAWLRQEAQSKSWKAKARQRTQGDLFDWAAAHAEVGKKTRKRPAKASSATPPERRRQRDGKPSRRRGTRRDHG